MKRIILALLIFLLITSCSDSKGIIEDLTSTLDKSHPVLDSYSLENNETLNISFTAIVEIIEVIVEGKKLSSPNLGKSFSFPLSTPLLPGENIRVGVTAKSENGNISRYSFIISGKNLNMPSLLINEVSIKGTSSSPDRIELLVLKDGDTAGVVVGDNAVEFTLPSINVNRGDLILIYWDKTTTKKSYERGKNKMTYILNARASSTLSGTEGIILLKEEKGGEIMDALIYSDKGEDAFSTAEKKELFTSLQEKNVWEGSPFDSSLVTSSRVIARLQGGIDFNNQEDFFITAARSSTFGEENIYEPYVPQ